MAHYSIKNLSLILISSGFLCLSCHTKTDDATIEKWKNEIIKAEQDFAFMAREKGVHDAFVAFAAEEAVLKRSDQLVIGKKAIDLHLKNDITTGLMWEPDFVDVSNSGDLGYTYGKYTLSYINEAGDSLRSSGYFHTVWKRQRDGSWKFVWD